VRADLVLEGGGARGLALGGAVAVLGERGVEFERVAGTSAGAIVGALVAAGLPPEGLDVLARDTSLSDIVPLGPLGRLGAVGRGVSVLFGLGLHDHRALKAWLDEQLGELGVETFGDLRHHDPDSSLPPDRAYRLVIIASDISRGRRVLLPWDLPDYGLDPDRFRVADAVAASAAIPLAFEPVRLPLAADAPVVDARSAPRRPFGRRGTPEAVLVDGGLVSNFPVDVFDRTDGRRPRWPTIGVKLSAQLDAPVPVRPVVGPVGYLRSVISTAVTAWDQRQLDDPCVVERTVFIDTTGVGPLDFDLDAATRARLAASGRTNAQAWLDGWDEEGYLERCRGFERSGSR
jgi:NTE family protein